MASAGYFRRSYEKHCDNCFHRKYFFLLLPLYLWLPYLVIQCIKSFPKFYFKNLLIAPLEVLFIEINICSLLKNCTDFWPQCYSFRKISQASYALSGKSIYLHGFLKLLSSSLTEQMTREVERSSHYNFCIA